MQAASPLLEKLWFSLYSAMPSFFMAESTSTNQPSNAVTY
jgi:hypothetical protein